MKRALAIAALAVAGAMRAAAAARRASMPRHRGRARAHGERKPPARPDAVERALLPPLQMGMPSVHGPASSSRASTSR